MSRALAATLMRGGSRKALFLQSRDLPGSARDRDIVLARLLGSPDSAARQLDGLGGTQAGHVVLVGASLRDDCDIDVHIGQVDARSGQVHWTTGEADLLAAAGAFALWEELHPCHEGVTRVRIWHGGARGRVDAIVPVRNGRVLETGSFREDGVPFDSAEIRLEFVDPADGARHGDLLPDDAPVVCLRLPARDEVTVSVLGGGWPAVFVRAQALGLNGRESAAQLARDRTLKQRATAIVEAARERFGAHWAPVQACLLGAPAVTLVCVAPPSSHKDKSGAGDAAGGEIDLIARCWQAGHLLAVPPVSVSVAIAIAAALPGTLVSEVARTLPGLATRIGHLGGAVAVGAELARRADRWTVDKVVISHGARRLMAGRVFIP